MRLLLTSVLPTATCAGPIWPVREQIADRHRQVVIGVHQACGPRNDAVPIRIGIVGEGDPEAILQLDEARHCVRARRVHPDLAVVIHGHERERRIDRRIDDGDVDLVDRVDRLPVRLRRAAKRVHAEREAGGADRIHVHDVSQILDVRLHKVLLVRVRRFDGRRERHTLHIGDIGFEQRVGAVLNPLGHVGVRGAAVGRVVLETPVFRRIVRRRDHNAVREMGRAAAVVGEDGPRDDGRRRDTGIALDDGLDAIGRQPFERGALRRFGQRMCVFAHVERAVDSVSAPVVADRLCDRDDVRLGERAVERRAAMPARSEGHELARVVCVRLPLVVRLFQPLEIDEDRLRGGFPRQRRDCPACLRCVTHGLLHDGSQLGHWACTPPLPLRGHSRPLGGRDSARRS